MKVKLAILSRSSVVRVTSATRQHGIHLNMASKAVANLGSPASNMVLEALRVNRPRVFKTMVELCSCAMAECRAFQALVHNGTIRSDADYEEYISPPLACDRDDCEELFDDLVHQALEKEIGAESVACDLGIDSMESGFSVTMETVTGNTLHLEVAIDEHDTDEKLMQEACDAIKGKPTGENFCFLSCRCMVTTKKAGESDDEEEEAETTEDDDDDDDDDDFVPSEESDGESRKRAAKRKCHRSDI